MKFGEKLLGLLLVLTMVLLSACKTAPPPSPTTAGNNATVDTTTAAVEATEGGSDNGSTQTTQGAQNTGSSNFKIGMAVREITNDFNRDIISGAQSVVESAGGTFVVTDANADYQKHNENIENLINSGIDGLIIQLGDAQQLAPLMAQAAEKGIPVVTCAVGSPVPNTLTDINGDNPLMTVLAANAMLSAINYSGDVYVVYVAGAPLLETRKRIFESICADFPNVRLHELPGDHSPAKTQTQVEELLIANPEPGSIAGIFGTADAIVTGANEAIRRAGRSEIKMLGFDGDLVAFQMLFQEDGPFMSTVVQDVPGIGSTAAEILIGVLDGSVDPESIPAQTAVNCQVATRKNGVEAAERRWTTNFWENASLNKSEIEAKFPQTDEVIVARPTVP